LSRLVVVSNRTATPGELKPGGLASGLHAALREHGGLWFGWSGRVAEQTAETVQLREQGNVEYATLDLGRRDHDEYYDGFANRTLWPLFHFRPSLVDFTRQAYAGYARVNALFAEHLARLLRPDDRVWVHDYHLIPLAEQLRTLGVRARIGFFLHTPFPPGALLTMLPVHRELFAAFAAYDLIGFQTEEHLRAFRDYVCDEIGGEVNERGVFSTQGGRRHFRAAVFPIGVDVEAIATQSRVALQQPAVRRLRQSIEDRALMIGVDRLDYSKGLPERFASFRQLLRSRPEVRRKVTFLQIATPSRSDVPEYARLRRELDRTTGAINGEFADPDWIPLRYVNKAYQHNNLMGFYRISRVGLVTPLRDGMNLVAKEFVASQDGDDPGVLVLSRFAGAAKQLTGAILTNPYDLDGTVEALRAALSMSPADRIARWRDLMAGLREYDITRWRHEFVQQLGMAAGGDNG
jgi:trehalose 6-phosphate synthase